MKKNRFQNAFTVCNVALDAVVTDMFGKSASSITAIYQMLSNGETWNPCDLYKIDMPQEMQDKQKTKAIKQALKLLVSEGVISPESASVAI